MCGRFSDWKFARGKTKDARFCHPTGRAGFLRWSLDWRWGELRQVDDVTEGSRSGRSGSGSGAYSTGSAFDGDFEQIQTPFHNFRAIAPPLYLSRDTM